MATRYCGIGGNDGNSGLTWALRKLTLNGVEETPVVANDIVYVGPGCYRELLTVDVSGGAGTEIVYVGDVTGEHTDGVGGIVRITGSDNDQTHVRARCIFGSDKDYRIFRGFSFDMTTGNLIYMNDCENWIVEDCFFQGSADDCIELNNVCLDNTIRRCVFVSRLAAIFIQDNVTQDDTGNLIENVFIAHSTDRGIHITRIGGVTIRNSTIMSWSAGIRVVLLAGGQTTTVENCILAYCGKALEAGALGMITEDFNTLYENLTDYTNVNAGANSQSYPPLFLPPVLHAGVSQVSGFQFPWWFGKLSEWSQVRAIAGSNEPTEDLFGIARPVTAAKNSWGPFQFHDMERETGTVHAGSVSLCLHDAGRHQIFVPVANESTTISVYVYREANYAGNNPQLLVKQPGQADDITTDAAAASQWNLLTTTLTPAADPPYVVVELVSRNTNGANDKVFFDDLVVN